MSRPTTPLEKVNTRIKINENDLMSIENQILILQIKNDELLKEKKQLQIKKDLLLKEKDRLYYLKEMIVEFEI